MAVQLEGNCSVDPRFQTSEGATYFRDTYPFLPTSPVHIQHGEVPILPENATLSPECYVEPQPVQGPRGGNKAATFTQEPHLRDPIYGTKEATDSTAFDRGGYMVAPFQDSIPVSPPLRATTAHSSRVSGQEYKHICYWGSCGSHFRSIKFLYVSFPLELLGWDDS